MKIVSWAILVPTGLALVVFSVVNRHAVTVDFWPLGFAPEVRLFAIILGVLSVGVFWGGLAAWLAGGAARKRAREAERRAASIETDLRLARQKTARLEHDLQTARASSTDALPPADAA